MARHQGAIDFPSNGEPALRQGAECLRNSHVAFRRFGGGGGKGYEADLGKEPPNDKKLMSGRVAPTTLDR